MGAASDNLFPKIITVVQSSDISAPSNGDWKIYSKAGGVYARSSNSVVGPFAAAGAAGAPSTVNYLVGTADAGLSAEIPVGTTPGGELGGTWASPTVDDTHAGGHHQSELDYVQITTGVTLTATTEGTAHTCITGTSQAYAAVPTLIEVYCPRLTVAALSTVVVLLFDGATVLGRVALASIAGIEPLHASYRLTPTAATHQYIVKAYTTANSSVFDCGAGGTGTELPAFLRITRV